MLSTLWWTPLAFAILALILLVITPIIVDRRVAEIRNALANGSEHARVLVNDLEAAFASQAFVTDSIIMRDTIAIATRGHLLNDEVQLRDALHRISPEADRKFDELNGLLLTWSASHHGDISPAQSLEQTRAVLGSAERLDSYLTTVSDSLRLRARRLEHLDVVSAMVLAPIALIAMLVVLWAGARLLTFARAVDLERAEVLRSTEARAALLRGVTHDVKNPLGAAAGFAQLLEEGVVGPMTPTQIDMIRRVRRLVKASVDIVTDLLELARDDGADLRLVLSQTDLGALTQEVVADHSGMARERGVSVDVAPSNAVLTTDAARVRRIVINLVSNAIKYTPHGGRVAVRVITGQRDGVPATIGIEVADNGPGIPIELRERVFEEFFRAANTRTDGATSGNGLGLAISRRLARLLGGDIVLGERDGGGCVFTVWLASQTMHRGRRASDNTSSKQQLI